MKNDTTFAHIEAQLNTYLNEHRLKPSWERTTILHCICQNRHPVTPPEIAEQVKAQRISRATVYNTFKILCLARILYATNKDVGSRSVRYELAGDKPNRIQMICRRCSRVVELKDTLIQNQIMTKRYVNFTPQQFSLYIYGECKTCRKRINKKKS